MASMAWKTMVAIDWEELAKTDSVLLTYFDATSFVGFGPHSGRSFGHNMCPIWSDIKKGVAYYYRFLLLGSK